MFMSGQATKAKLPSAANVDARWEVLQAALAEDWPRWCAAYRQAFGCDPPTDPPDQLLAGPQIALERAGRSRRVADLEVSGPVPFDRRWLMRRLNGLERWSQGEPSPIGVSNSRSRVKK
jgi:hypothetical protein